MKHTAILGKNSLVFQLGLFFLLFLAPIGVHAISLPLQVTVNNTLNLSLNQSVVDFGKVKPGDAPFNFPTPNALRLTAKNNSGNSWRLSISAASDFVVPGTSLTFSVSNLKWYPVYSQTNGGATTPAPGTVHGLGGTPSSVLKIPSSATIYECGAGDTVSAGTDVDIMFGLLIPNNIKTGAYQTSLVFTLTE
jgi:hypothetical protein